MSPYGQSIFADAIDAIQAVDVAFDAMISLDTILFNAQF